MWYQVLLISKHLCSLKYCYLIQMICTQLYVFGVLLSNTDNLCNYMVFTTGSFLIIISIHLNTVIWLQVFLSNINNFDSYTGLCQDYRGEMAINGNSTLHRTPELESLPQIYSGYPILGWITSLEGMSWCILSPANKACRIYWTAWNLLPIRQIHKSQSKSIFKIVSIYFGSNFSFKLILLKSTKFVLTVFQ